MPCFLSRRSSSSPDTGSVCIMKSWRQHEAQIFYKKVSLGPVRFIYNENIRNFHQASFHRLHFIAGFGHNYHNGDVCKTRNLNFALAHTNRLNNDVIKRRGFQQIRDLDDFGVKSPQ